MTDTGQKWDDVTRNLEQLRDRLAPVSRSYVTTVLDQVTALRKACEEREAELVAAVAAAVRVEAELRKLGDLASKSRKSAWDAAADLLAAALRPWAGREARACRRCSECQGQDHHWMDAVAYECKHCDALAMACEDCMEAPASHGDLCGDCVQHRHEPASSGNARCAACGWAGDSSAAASPGPYYACPRCGGSNIHLSADDDGALAAAKGGRRG